MASSSSSTVIVIGAAGGIGLEVVKQLVVSHTVLAVVLNSEQAQAALQAGASQALECDVSDEVATAAVLQALASLIPREGLAAVINCAAIQPIGVIEAVSRQQLEQLFAVNVFGTLQITQGLIPALRAGSGRLVLFSSMAGRVTSPLLGAYSATKFALEALANALRMELHGQVEISLIEPGGVSTPMAATQQALADKGLAALTDYQRTHYAGLYRGYRATAGKALQHASTPQAVAQKAVQAAIGSARPKPRYVVGADAKLTVGLGQLLPTRWFDALIYSLFSK